jgi:molecular chaperone IbpA
MTTFQRDLFLGFDDLFNSLTKPTSKQQSYPPYNVVKIDDNNYLIEIAVAGFDADDITIELLKGQLTVAATPNEHPFDINYVHKGISSRAFVRAFTLADSIEVRDAEIHKGVLQIRLINRQPEEDKPKQINIIGSTVDKQLLTEGC